MTLTDLTLTEALDKLHSGEIKAVELTQAHLDRIVSEAQQIVSDALG